MSNSEPSPAASHVPPPHPSFREALAFWFKLGWISFGGPAGQIAIMHRELVERRRWLGERSFLQGLNFCMLLPGPEAQQLATYLGWRLHGLWGGVAAGVWFVLPSALILYLLSWLYIVGGHTPWLAGIFHGLVAAVMAVVVEAVLRIGRKALLSPALWALAGVSFGAIFFLHISFVWIVLGAGLLGALGNRWRPALFPAGKGHGGSHAQDELPTVVLRPVPPAGWGRALRVSFTCLALWWLPVWGLSLALGPASTPVQQGLFFSKAALVTFGGAYAVLPYVAQQAVETHGWLTHPQMMAGLGLAETTPGPLIMVLQFVGFIGAWQHPGALSPLAAATLGAAITTWVTFVPCFLFVFLGAPYLERLGKMPRLSAALTAITAAVVGVILNLGVQFGLHALWPTDAAGVGRGFDLFVLAISVGAFVALQRFKVGLIPTLAVCAALGWATAWLPPGALLLK